MSLLDEIRARNGLPVARNSQPRETDGFSAQSRLNFLTLGNTIELGTEIIHELLRRNSGLSNQVGDQRLLKRDVADMLGGKLASKLQQFADSRTGGAA